MSLNLFTTEIESQITIFIEYVKGIVDEKYKDEIDNN
jgi:hypothetical protein